MLVLVTSIEIIYSFETHHNGETRDSTGSLGSIIKGIVIAYSIAIFMVKHTNFESHFRGRPR